MSKPRQGHSVTDNAYAEPEPLFSLGWMDLDILPRETHELQGLLNMLSFFCSGEEKGDGPFFLSVLFKLRNRRGHGIQPH